MKKILLTLCALLMAVSGAWADDFTAPDFTATAPTSLKTGWHQIKWVTIAGTSDYTNDDVNGHFVYNYAQDETVNSTPYALYLGGTTISTLDDCAKTFVYIEDGKANGAYGITGKLQSANGHYISLTGASSLTGVTNYISYFSSTNYPNNSIITSGSTGDSRYSLVPQGKNDTPYIGRTSGTKQYPMVQFSPVSITDLGLTAWTVTIEGLSETVASDNTQVTYSGGSASGLTSVYNNGTFFIDENVTPAASDFSAPKVSGVTPTITVGDGTVTVTYTLNVTYKVVYGSSVVNTSAATTQDIGAAPSLPELNVRAYCTYEYYSDQACTEALEALTGESTEVYAKCTYSGPFNFASSAEDATTNGYWTALKLAATDNYVYCSDGSLAYTTTIAVDNKYQWAIIGHPYGYKLYNRGAGDDNSGAGYLYSSSVPTSNGKTTDQFSFNSTGLTFELYRLTGRDADNFVSIISGTNTNANSGTAINYAADKLMLWCGKDNSGFTCNNGYMSGLSQSFLCPAAVPSYSSLVTTYITPYYDTAGEFFSITSDAKTSLDDEGYTAALTSCDEVTYNSLLAIVEGADINYPETGFYRIESYNTSGAYIGKESNVATKSSGGSAVSTVVYLTNKGDNTYAIQVQGGYLQTPTNNAQVTTGENPVYFTPTVAGAGIISLNAGGGTHGNLHAQGSTGVVIGWTATGISENPGSYWKVEDATSATISLTAANDNTGTAHTYATLCVPFNVTGLTGVDSKEVKAYAPTISGNYVVPGSGASTIAAGTPVVLIGEEDATSVTAAIGSTYVTTPVAATSSNVLTGTFTTTRIDVTANTGTNYVLGFDASNSNRIGFYHVANDEFALGANRAYLNTSAGGSVKGFAINFTEDGVDSIVSEQQTGTFYDLSGRKVAQPKSGLYIVNGKKVVIK